MRVLHLLASNKYSGAENVVCQIIENFNGKIEMAYCSPLGNISKTLEEKKIKYFPLKKMSIKEVKKIIKKYKPDVIHAHDFRASLISAVFSKKVYIISHIHKNPDWVNKKNFRTYLYQIASRKFSNILLVSKECFDKYPYLNSIEKKISIVGNPINAEKIKNKSIEYEFEKKYDLLYLGRLSEEKDPLKFLKIIKIIKKKHFYIKAGIVGDGNLKEILKKEILENDLQTNVDLLGFIDNPYPILKKCKVLCITSIYEGFGLVAAEAMVLSKPVVSTSCGGVSNIVDENCGKICIDMSSFCDELNALLSNNEYYFNKSKNATLKANKLNNINEYMNKLKIIYCEKEKKVK